MNHNTPSREVGRSKLRRGTSFQIGDRVLQSGVTSRARDTKSDVRGVVIVVVMVYVKLSGDKDGCRITFVGEGSVGWNIRKPPYLEWEGKFKAAARVADFKVARTSRMTSTRTLRALECLGIGPSGRD
jgi:hypothetical protein